MKAAALFLSLRGYRGSFLVCANAAAPLLEKRLFTFLFSNDCVDAILYNKSAHFISKDQSKSSKNHRNAFALWPARRERKRPDDDIFMIRLFANKV